MKFLQKKVIPKYSLMSFLIITFFSVLFLGGTQEIHKKGKLAPKPLFRDPVYDGAADPTVIWNQKEKKWFMFYTNRRANVDSLKGITWVHGTHIGIAESSDGGATWQYSGTCNIPPPFTETQWAPEVIEYQGLYHMYLTYVPGIFNNWKHPRHIIHLTSKNLIDWKYESTLELASNKVIDPCVLRLHDGSWRIWYNNEADHKSMYYADSKDLYHWEDKGKAVGDQPGEGPKVFKWKNKYWMVTDVWHGLALYESGDLISWKRIPGNLVEEPGKGKDDGVVGHHPDVVVSNGRAYLFYFTHPGRVDSIPEDNLYEKRRSSIQVTELEYKEGKITCDRDKPTYIDLQPPK
jgi:sucrose-6-phosphate hydrolase SacC (GH32 family)